MLARRTDPPSSHAAAQAVKTSPTREARKKALNRLLTLNEGATYQELFAAHRDECDRLGKPLLFPDAPSLMKRLNDWAMHHGWKNCQITGKRVRRWYPRC